MVQGQEELRCRNRRSWGTGMKGAGAEGQEELVCRDRRNLGTWTRMMADVLRGTAPRSLAVTVKMYSARSVRRRTVAVRSSPVATCRVKRSAQAPAERGKHCWEKRGGGRAGEGAKEGECGVGIPGSGHPSAWVMAARQSSTDLPVLELVPISE